jgi:hypothetical protein
MRVCVCIGNMYIWMNHQWFLTVLNGGCFLLLPFEFINAIMGMCFFVFYSTVVVGLGASRLFLLNLTQFMGMY